MRNYLSSLVEAEAILACQAVGLDPGLGIIHADARGRPSLALDRRASRSQGAAGFPAGAARAKLVNLNSLRTPTDTPRRLSENQYQRKEAG